MTLNTRVTWKESIGSQGIRSRSLWLTFEARTETLEPSKAHCLFQRWIFCKIWQNGQTNLKVSQWSLFFANTRPTVRRVWPISIDRVVHLSSACLWWREVSEDGKPRGFLSKQERAASQLQPLTVWHWRSVLKWLQPCQVSPSVELKPKLSFNRRRKQGEERERERERVREGERERATFFFFNCICAICYVCIDTIKVCKKP